METTYRKKQNGVVINTNKSGYYNAVKAKEKVTKDQQRLNNLESDVKELKDDIKTLIKIIKDK